MDDAVKIAKSIINFLRENNQLSLLPEIIDCLKAEEERISGESTAVVTSAYPLSEEELSFLQKKLIALFKHKLELINKVNKNIVGGFKIQISDKILDLSLQNYLSSLEEQLKNEKN